MNDQPEKETKAEEQTAAKQNAAEKSADNKKTENKRSNAAAESPKNGLPEKEENRQKTEPASERTEWEKAETNREKTDSSSSDDEKKEETAMGAPDESATDARADGEEKLFSENVFGALYTLAAQFPENDVAQDVSSEAFRLFAAGKRGDITSIYEKYLAFRKAFGEMNAKPERKTGETAPAQSHSEKPESAPEPKYEPEPAVRSYSGYPGGTPPVDYGMSLTARQMLIARKSGMSYREYAELLNSVPHGTGRKSFGY